jgi:hypothetical protein
VVAGIIALTAAITAGIIYWDQIKTVAGKAIDYIKMGLETIKNLLDKIQSIIVSVFNWIKNLGNVFSGGLTGGLWESLKNFEAKYVGLSKLPKLLGFQYGGIVPGSIGMPMPAVVHGGETIIPPGAAAGHIFNFHFEGAFIGDKERFISEIKRAINRESELKSLAGL